MTPVVRLEQGQSLPASYQHELRARGYRSDPSQLAAIDALSDLRERLIQRRRRERSPAARLAKVLMRRAAASAEPGVYLAGPVGRGKTWLMDLFVRSLPFPEVRRRHFYRFMAEVHAALRIHAGLADPLQKVAADIAAEIRVLCFDELFVTDIADAMILGTLFEALFRHGVTLVATSNTPPEGLYRDGLQRARFLPAIELLQQNLRLVMVDGGTDYRLRSLQRAGTWLSATAPDSDAALGRLFTSLTKAAAAVPGAITIAARDIPVRGVDSEAVWFEFDAICDGPRAPADYIEIARSWPTVLIAHVPVFTQLSENAARRFITLVDELYDHDVKLAVSAAAAPQELYRGERLTLEFQRTASRLIEMQTPDYLARAHRPEHLQPVEQDRP